MVNNVIKMTLMRRTLSDPLYSIIGLRDWKIGPSGEAFGYIGVQDLHVSFFLSV